MTRNECELPFEAWAEQFKAATGGWSPPADQLLNLWQAGLAPTTAADHWLEETWGRPTPWDEFCF